MSMNNEALDIRTADVQLVQDAIFTWTKMPDTLRKTIVLLSTGIVPAVDSTDDMIRALTESILRGDMRGDVKLLIREHINNAMDVQRVEHNRRLLEVANTQLETMTKERNQAQSDLAKSQSYTRLVSFGSGFAIGFIVMSIGVVVGISVVTSRDL